MTIWQSAVISALLPGLIVLPQPLRANPSGGVVKAGSAQIDAATAGHLKVFQQSNRAIINWESFSIAAGETTQFIQPSASAVALSRVVGGNPSAIYGTLKANGGHILVNQNGILVGDGGVVDVGGLNVLSTLDIDDNNFMAGGDMRFVGSTSAGVQNFGSITSAGGDVILMGNFVENHGSIGALNGTVALGAGGEIILHSTGDSKISIMRGGVGGPTGVNNTGTITGAAVEMKAHGNVYALAVNNSGTIRATGASRVNGRVILSATGDGSASGKIVNTGVIEANNRDGSGGTILIDAGVAGEAEIGGTVRADGIGNKPGGTVTVQGDIINVTEGALVSASGGRGGTVTIGSQNSSSVNVAPTATVQATGTSGVAGTIMVAGQQVGLEGTLDATSAQSDGGQIQVRGADVSTAASAVINASGFGSGGAINIRGTEALSVGGRVISEGQNGVGGRVILTAPNTVIREGAQIKADGASQGGSINTGGGFQGKDPGIPNAGTTTVEEGAALSADSTRGNGGTVVVWADQDTTFLGDVRARALGPIGNGGLIEISGKETLTVSGSVEASSVGGRAGTVLFDPGNVTIGNVAPGPGIIQNSTINDTLQSGTSVIISTFDGDVTFLNSGLANLRHGAIQWTYSDADFGVFAGGDIRIFNHIRTSGGGSINLMAGWISDQDIPQAGPLDPEGLWESYLEAGAFGQNNNGVFMGMGVTRPVEVGSRFGNTNVAGAFLNMFASDVNVTDAHVQLGFRDTGQVFSRRDGNIPIDPLSNGAANPLGNFDNNGGPTDNDVLVGFYDLAYFRDVNGDGIPDGVYGIDSSGLLDGSPGSSTPGNPTFIPFANAYMNRPTAGTSNWWWQQIDARNPDLIGLGGMLPEHGAGGRDTFTGAANPNALANINVAVTGSVTMTGGGRERSYVQIGHGGGAGNAANAGDNLSTVAAPFVSYNGSAANTSGNSIARLAPVYGNIHILAGVDRATVAYDRNHPSVNLTGTTNNPAGSVNVIGWQSTASADALNNPESFNNFDSYAQIGHLGPYQFGSVSGNINVKAGGSVNVLAGAHTRNFAAIGHQMGNASYWNPASNVAPQVRFFNNAQDFNNSNLRKGELFADPFGNDSRGYFPDDFGAPLANPMAGRYDADFWDVDGDLNNNGIIDSTEGTTNLPAPLPIGNTRGVAVTGRLGFTPIHIPAFSGAVEKTLNGNITVESFGVGGVRVAGFSTPDTRLFADRNGDGKVNSSDVIGDGSVNPLNRDGLLFSRDNRYAMIGHGGVGVNSADATEGILLYVLSGNGTGATSAASDTILLINGIVVNPGQGAGGTDINLNRSSTFVNLIGNIDVVAHAGGVEVSAGSDSIDFAAIGHGGVRLGDLETSNVMAGDINVSGARNLLIQGGGVVTPYTGDLATAREFRSYAQIGHHGVDARIQYYTGDIVIDFGGDITLTGGRYQGSNAKIGHQSSRGFGQTGGSLNRTEQFLWGPHYERNPASDNFSPIAAHATVTDSEVGITVGNSTRAYGLSGYTADITVNAGGDVLMQHSDPGLTLTQNRAAAGGVSPVQPVRWVDVQIGHGGRNTGTPRNDSLATQNNLKDKIGDITVTAENITMRNGSGHSYLTTIGHFYGSEFNEVPVTPADIGSGENLMAGARFDASNGDISRAGLLAGDISITARGNLEVDGNFARPNDPVNIGSAPDGVGLPVQYNFVRIGHGGLINNSDVNVGAIGTMIHGLAASSDIFIDVGGNMTVDGGEGEYGSHAQVGHGYNSTLGSHTSRPAGFNGGIFVNVDRDLSLTAGSRAYSDRVGGLDVVQGKARTATIGHGGDMLEGALTGNIEVVVGLDLFMTAAQRTQPAANIATTNDPALALYGFAKIGHWSTAYQPLPTFQQIDSSQSGEILVVVGENLTMRGGTTEDTEVSDGGGDGGVSRGFFRSPTVMGFAQIGHSAPGVNGLKEGEIDIRVGNDLVTVDGTVDPNWPANPDGSYYGLPNFNNYVMIGHGDWLRDGLGNVSGPTTAASPGASGTGIRTGNISVATGRDATFNHTLVGHADPAVIPSALAIAQGHTYVAVGRNVPFYGGTGILRATSSVPFDVDPDGGGFVPGGPRVGSVFTSGRYGGDELRFYIPQREGNEMDAATTRMNSATSVYRGVGGTGGVSFTGGNRLWDPTRNGGVDAGDTDEIYLQPDLWWNRTQINTSAGLAADFPTGSIATVEAPGGLPNLVSLAAGVLGDGTSEYRGEAGAQYTVYYDAISPVSLTPRPPIPVVPEIPPFFPGIPEIPDPVVIPIPFDFLPFIFWDKFDSFDRDNRLLFASGDGFLEWLRFYLEGIEGKSSEGLLFQSELAESLAETLGWQVDETDEVDEDEFRRRTDRIYRHLNSLYGIYWRYHPHGEGNGYSSYKLFGTPGI